VQDPELNEGFIKRAVIAELLRRSVIPRGCCIANEFVIQGTGCRADLAFMGSTPTIGIEIKSNLDSLKRLPKQIEAYGGCFDSIIVVVTAKHLRKTLVTVPSWAAVWVVQQDGIIRIQRDGSHRRRPTKRQLVRLLSLPNLRRLAGKRAASVRVELEALAVRNRIETIRGAVANSFRQKFAGPSAEFWSSLGDTGAISDLPLDALSRFRSRRAAAALAATKADEFWENWRLKAELAFGNAKPDRKFHKSLHSSSVSYSPSSSP